MRVGQNMTEAKITKAGFIKIIKLMNELIDKQPKTISWEEWITPTKRSRALQKRLIESGGFFGRSLSTPSEGKKRGAKQRAGECKVSGDTRSPGLHGNHRLDR
jgi:hypothetical protein